MQDQSQDLEIVNEETKGLLAAESSRYIAEIQGQMTLAKKFPRKHSEFMPDILEACKSKSLASISAYLFPKGGTTITGPSIRLAEVVAQNYGNLDFGIKVLQETSTKSLIQSYCYDLQKNVRSQKVFEVKHQIKLKNGSMKILSDPREIYEHQANYGTRRLRACIMGIIPRDIFDQAQEQCEKTNTGDGKTPIKDKILEMIKAFETLGVTKEMIEARLQHNIDATDWPEISTLQKIWTSLKDNMAKRSDFFDLPKAEAAKENSPDDLKESLKAETTELSIKGKESKNKPAKGESEAPDKNQKE